MSQIQTSMRKAGEWEECVDEFYEHVKQTGSPWTAKAQLYDTENGQLAGEVMNRHTCREASRLRLHGCMCVYLSADGASGGRVVPTRREGPLAIGHDPRSSETDPKIKRLPRISRQRPFGQLFPPRLRRFPADPRRTSLVLFASVAKAHSL